MEVDTLNYKEHLLGYIKDNFLLEREHEHKYEFREFKFFCKECGESG